MQLTENFELWEFERSQVATRYGIDNSASGKVVDNLQRLCVNILQPLRDEIGKVININSGYRCEKLEEQITKPGFKNWCLKEGYSMNERSWNLYFEKKSHPKGEAADIEVFGMSNTDLFNKIKEMELEYDQLILEFHNPSIPQSGWVHVSYSPLHRRQSFSIG